MKLSKLQACLLRTKPLDLPPIVIERTEKVPETPKRERALCGAKTRAGTPCQARAVEGNRRCRLHGGESTGPTSAEGRKAISESVRRRAAERREVLA